MRGEVTWRRDRQREGDSRDLIAFVRARLADDERHADLFHELDCSVPDHLTRQGRRPGRRWRCRCPVPVQLAGRVHALRRILHTCEDLIDGLAPVDPYLPLDPAFAEPALRILAQHWEDYPAWRGHWSL